MNSDNSNFSFTKVVLRDVYNNIELSGLFYHIKRKTCNYLEKKENDQESVCSKN